MSIDLLQMIRGATTQQVIDKVGGELGMEPKQASSAFDMASAAVLGGILRKASSPDGAKSILDMAKRADLSVLDKLGDLDGGSRAASDAFQRTGGGLLDSILGGNKSVMIEALAKAIGVDSSVIEKLLAMIAPIVMGVIGKQVKSQGLDLGGLGGLLGAQKKSLAGYLPGNLTSDLGLGNVLGDVSKTASATTGAARQMGSAVGSAGQQASGGLAKVLIPLVLILGVGFLLWKYLAPQDEQLANQPNNAGRGLVSVVPESTETSSAKLTDALDSMKDSIPKFDMDISSLGEAGSTMKTEFTDITSGLAGLSESAATEDKAKELFEKVNNFAGKVDGLELSKLEGIAKTVSSGLIGKFLESIDGLLEKVPQPQRGIVEPAIKNLVEKLERFK